MRIEIGLSEAELVEQCAQEMRRKVEEVVGRSFRDTAGEIIAEHIEQRVKELADEAIQAEVRKVLTEGWRTTNQYGEPLGKVVTVRSKVLECLVGTAYRNPVDEALRVALEAELKGELGALLAEAKKKLRETLDTRIAEKLRGVVTEAIR